jgi:hypothetical protein
MTEAQWLACTDVSWLLDYLTRRQPGPDARQLRLFACACCRRLWSLLPDPRSRAVVAVAEAFADGRVGRAKLQEAWREARPVTAAGHALRALEVTAYHGRISLALQVRDGTRACVEAVVEATRNIGAWGAERAAQAVLAHDVFGNPFRLPSADPAWLRWREGMVACMVQGIYSEQRFGDLPILADALEEAGCADPEILGHCRGPGPHARGCWVLDLLGANPPKGRR